MKNHLDQLRNQAGADSIPYTNMLSYFGQQLVEQGRAIVAEPILRECLAIRMKKQPDEWPTFNAKSRLGGALLGQKKYAEAEPLLLSGYEGLKQREDKIPRQARDVQIEALQRLVHLYEDMDKKDQAGAWWNKMEEAAGEFIRTGVNPAIDAYNAACFLARCVPLPERDKERAQNYADRAIAMLRQAVRSGFKDAAHMKKDTDLDPLRWHPEFQKLLKELEDENKQDGR